MTYPSIKLNPAHTNAHNKAEHLNDVALGAKLEDNLLASLEPEHNDVQIVISDSLSTEAIHHNTPKFLFVLLDGLKSQN